ncbi:sodium-coupled monocarboxylate transporter 2 isoform X2 [Teleopsis dalmanni]|nr:sodium-coupled monocarboxylate transporter 2 isoform X2 [Teleopsis dalmanni]XP_037958515.1 sodium-coupled monocarboxylate transporter 2 isoform X2 [Teleopsis dalmanni]
MDRQIYTKYEEFHFHAVDYIVFAIMISVSTGTGIYFGYFKKQLPDDPMIDSEGRKKTDFGSTKMNEYLLGSRNLKIFPVAMSLVGSYISGVTILGTASEIYNFGTQYWIVVIPIVLMAFTVSKIYLPVFATVGVGSSYEYLEMRFNSHIRSMISFMFVLDEIFFLPIIIYVPAIAFNQVSGINVHVICGIICLVCVFYTLVGGIKAVVHTDAWQILVMFISVLAVVILGSVASGGPVKVFEEANKGGRIIFFNINPSMFERQTVWGILIGGFCYWTSFNSVNQTMVQRYMSLSTLKKAQWSIFVFSGGIILFISVCCYAGLLVYDFYKRCDPLTAGLIHNDDQLLPVYVMQTVGHLHGVPGLFIAGVFGAALSSLSVVLNSTALVFLEDIVKGCLKQQISEKISTIIVKSSIIFLGLIALSLVFVLEKLSGILSVATSVTAIAAGTSFGVFSLGMLIPWANSKGAIAGAVAGALMSGWISFGTQMAVAFHHLSPHDLPISVEECPSNVTITRMPSIDETNIFPLYRLSFHWINPIGVLTTIGIGTIASFLTGATTIKKLDADLLSPIIHRYLPKECFLSRERGAGDVSGENNMQTLTHLLHEHNGESDDQKDKY